MKVFSLFFCFIFFSFDLFASGHRLREKVPDPTNYLLAKLVASEGKYSFLCDKELGVTAYSFIWLGGAYGFVLGEEIVENEDRTKWWRILKVFWLNNKTVQESLILEAGRGRFVLLRNLELLFVKEANWGDSRLLRFFIEGRVLGRS